MCARRPLAISFVEDENMKTRKKKAAGAKPKRKSNPPKKFGARKRRATAAPKKRRYSRKRAKNPPGAMREILGAVLGGLGASLAGNLLAAVAGGKTNPGMAQAIRVAVPTAIALAASRQPGPMAAAVGNGAWGAAGVELADVVSGLIRKPNPPIQILRRPNPGPIRFANPQGGETSYPATVSGMLPPPFLSPLRFVPTANPYK